MARWDDLHRAIAARDAEGTERIWLELLETDLDEQGRFLGAARTLAALSGGKRQAGILLWMLAETLREKGRTRDLVPVYVHLSRMAPDDGTVRQGLIDAARAAHPDRVDLEALLEKSGMTSGGAADLPQQAERFAGFLRLEPGAFVFHRGGWGAGRIVGYLPERGRCVIDFHDRPGHEMDLEAAAERLERLDEKDIRALALANPKALRRWASEDPLEMIRQVLVRFGGSTRLRHVRDALVPDAVATTAWSAWWREAKSRAHLDPRFHVAGGRDPEIEFHEQAVVDFKTQVERRFAASATVEDRQRAAREFIQTVAHDDVARATLAELLRAEREKARTPAARMGWNVVLAALGGGDERAAVRAGLLESDDPKKLIASIFDDEGRTIAARVLIEASDRGADLLYEAALEQDDPVLAEVGVDRFEASGRKEFFGRLLDEIDARPAQRPNLWAWYVRGLRRERWSGRSYEPYALVVRLLKILDAVDYRSRRAGGGTEREKAGVSALNDVLTLRDGAVVREAAEATDRAGAHHLVRVLENIRGLRGRVFQKVQAIVLRVRPDALKSVDAPVAVVSDVAVGERLDRVYMTPEGMGRLRADRDQIVNVEMAANALEIARAREFGDLSENAEYHAARERQSLLQARAAAMSGELARAAPITPEMVRVDTVSVGARIRCRDGSGQEVTYTLLGPPDVDVKRGIINYLTPLGQALMGRAVGDRVQVALEGGDRDLEILGIESGLVP